MFVVSSTGAVQFVNCSLASMVQAQGMRCVIASRCRRWGFWNVEKIKNRGPLSLDVLIITKIVGSEIKIKKLFENSNVTVVFGITTVVDRRAWCSWYRRRATGEPPLAFQGSMNLVQLMARGRLRHYGLGLEMAIFVKVVTRVEIL